MPALILPKLGNCTNANQALRELERMGAKQIGSGHFARVFRIEARSYLNSHQAFMMEAPASLADIMRPVFDRQIERRVSIIKVVMRKDRGALLVAKAAMATADIDPLAPRYYGITEFADGSWMAELEELTPLRLIAGFEERSDPHSLAVKQGITGRAGARHPLPDVVSASPFLTILRQHMERDGNYSWDIHGDNVMLRNGNPVITDPIYYGPDC